MHVAWRSRDFCSGTYLHSRISSLSNVASEETVEQPLHEVGINTWGYRPPLE